VNSSVFYRLGYDYDSKVFCFSGLYPKFGSVHLKTLVESREFWFGREAALTDHNWNHFRVI
jgi:hypothetical protein